MKSRPILFKPELLDLICQGKKTQTRRLDRRWLSLDVGDELWCKERLDRLPRPNIYGRDIAEYSRDCQTLPIDWKWQRDWLSPLHMPRAAARVFLEVVEKPRVERLSDITRPDALAEGFPGCGEFLHAWQSIHADRDGRVDWDAEVVVIRFRVREVTS